MESMSESGVGEAGEIGEAEFAGDELGEEGVAEGDERRRIGLAMSLGRERIGSEVLKRRDKLRALAKADALAKAGGAT